MNRIFARDASNSLVIRCDSGGGDVRYGTYSNDAAFSGACPTSGWHELTIVREGTNVLLYIDGAYFETETYATSIAFNKIQTEGGYRNSHNYISFYNRPLSPVEISQNCNALESRFTASDDICP